MVQVISQAGLGDLLGSSIGQGISKGAETGSNMLMKRFVEQQKLKSFSNMLQNAGQQNMAGMGSGSGGGESQNPFTTIMSNPMLFAQASAAGYGDLVKAGAEHAFKQQEAQVKKAEKIAPYESALDAVNRSRELLEKGNLGTTGLATAAFSSKPGAISEAKQDRTEYEQLGKSLIQVAAGMKGMKGKEAFNTYAKDLGNPRLSVARMKGSLNAMDRIIRGNLKSYGINPPQAQPFAQQDAGQPQQARKSLSTPQAVPQFKVGQQFQAPPQQAPEGSIISQGNKKFIFRQGQWSPL